MAAEAAAEAQVSMACLTCGVDKPLSEVHVWKHGLKMYARCKNCASASGKLKRALESLSGPEADLAQHLTAEQKKAFMVRRNSCSGAAMKAALVTFCEHSVRETKTSSINKNKDFYDEYELAQIYKGREDQMHSIMANATKTWHTERGVYVYGVSKLTEITEVKTEERQEHSLSVEYKEQQQPQKKKRGSGGAGGVVDPGLLKAKDGVQMHDQLLTCIDDVNARLAVLDSNEKLVGWCSEALRSRAAVAVKGALSLSVEFHLASEKPEHASGEASSDAAASSGEGTTQPKMKEITMRMSECCVELIGIYQSLDAAIDLGFRVLKKEEDDKKEDPTGSEAKDGDTEKGDGAARASTSASSATETKAATK
jgi:hypothetical protein